MIQGTELWMATRLGKITSSKMGDIMAETTTGRFKAYILEKAVERLTGIQKSISSAPIEWGWNYEEEARLFYEKRTGNTVIETGFLEASDIYGGSPDGLVGFDGLLEIKCPYNSANFITSVLKGGAYKTDHVWQMQSLMGITGRKWCDYVCYDPRMERKINIVRYQRDELMIERMMHRIPISEIKIQEICKKLTPS
jgi:hypothetical protein